MKKALISQTQSANIGSVLASLRKVVTGHCEHCGKEIEGIKTKKYCNDSCKRKAYLKRKSLEKDEVSNEKDFG